MATSLARLGAQLLAGRPARDPRTVVERLLAVQAQDLTGARLAIRARSAGVTVDDVDRSLADRSLVTTWLNRGTLHLVRREDYPWLQALTAPTSRTANARRLVQEGLSIEAADRGTAVIVRALDGGPLSRRDLRQRLDEAGVRTAGQAFVHLLIRASLDGRIVRGPMVDGQQAFVLVEDWLGPPPPFDRPRALAELARRYLAGHAPADERDLATWSGVPLGQARAGLRSIGGELRELPGGLVTLGRVTVPRRLPPPRLLGPFEPLLLGWRDRTPVLGEHRGVVTVNGIFRAVALVEGRAVGTWSLSGASVTLRPFAPLDPQDEAALAADAVRLARFFGAAARPMAVEPSTG